MELDEFGTVNAHYFCHEDAVGEVAGYVALGPAERDAVDPFQELFHFVLVYRGSLHL